MAAWHWVAGVVGLFVVWVAMSFIGQFTGYIIGLQDYLYDKFNESGMPIPSAWQNITDQLNSYFQTTWAWIPLVVFISFIIFIVIGSLKKRPEDEYIPI